MNPLTRRGFLSLAGSALPLLAAADRAPAMRIDAIETVYWPSRNAAPWQPHWTWVRIHTDQGVTGLGETYPRNETEATLVHSAVAHSLLGRDPRNVERIWAELYRTFDYQITGGTEMRVLSAIDLALWDLLGNALNTPVYELLGGKSNSTIRVYNTSFPYKYDFNKEPEKIMRELIEQHGVTGIKIWPFDGAAARNAHQFITVKDIDEALTPVKRLRDTFGDAIEILIEFHANWNLTSAIRIANALEPYKPMWLEDMLLPGNFAQYHELAASTSLPLTAGERMAGRYAFESLFESRAVKFCMFDVCWCGGLTEARKIAAMADTYKLPIAPHTAGGPLLFYASTHLTTAETNVWIQESVQRYYEHDWPLMLENPLVPENGRISAPELPGLGMRVKDSAWNHPAAVHRISKA